jgi:hypothetical protein
LLKQWTGLDFGPSGPPSPLAGKGYTEKHFFFTLDDRDAAGLPNGSRKVRVASTSDTTYKVTIHVHEGMGEWRKVVNMGEFLLNTGSNANGDPMDPCLGIARNVIIACYK